MVEVRDEAGARFQVAATPGGRSAFVAGWDGRAGGRSLGFAIVYRAEAGDRGAFRIDLSGEADAGLRHITESGDLDAAIADAKCYLAGRL